MNLTHQEHHVNGAVKRLFNSLVNFKTLGQCSLHKTGQHKMRAAGAIHYFLELARHFAGPHGHDLGVSLFQGSYKIIKVAGRPGHLLSLGHDPVGFQNIVCILRTLAGNNPMEDDVNGLFHQKLRPLDVIREVSLKEGEIRFGSIRPG